VLDHPEIGRPGHVAGTRERVVAHTPHLLIYRINDETIEILRIWHGKAGLAEPTCYLSVMRQATCQTS